MSGRWRRRAALTLAVLAWAPAAHADAIDQAQTQLEGALKAAEAVPAISDGEAHAASEASELLEGGRKLLKARDYAHAQDALSAAIERGGSGKVATEALLLRAQAAAAVGDWPGARRDYRAVLSRDPSTAQREQAAAQLLHVAIRRELPAEIRRALADAEGLGQGAELTYQRAKAYLALGDESRAAQLFAQVGAPFEHQAKYFLGVLAIRSASTAQPASEGQAAKVDYRAAIERFNQVAALPADSPEHQEVIDLARIAVARLYYEAERYSEAAQAYHAVSQRSKHFETALYELAWVYVRIGDVVHAEQALNMLALSDLGSPELGEAALLRADLLLRAGAFRKSEALYSSVKDLYEPSYLQLSDFVAKNTDTGQLFEQVTRESEEQELSGDVPALVSRWMHDEPGDAQALALVDDVQDCRRLLAESKRAIQKLSATLSGSHRAGAFGDLSQAQLALVTARGQLVRARAQLADALEQSGGGEQIAALRASRKQAQQQAVKAPSNEAEVAAWLRKEQGPWVAVEKSLAAQQSELDRQRAQLNGVRVAARNDSSKGEQLTEIERELRHQQHELQELGRALQLGKAQVGLEAESLRQLNQASEAFRGAFAAELSALAAGQGGASASKAAARVQPLVQRIDAAQQRLDSLENKLKSELDRRSAKLSQQLDGERSQLAGHEQRLAQLEQEAREVIGSAARRNYVRVLDKLQGLVVRADVGLTEHAWEVREEEMYRVRELQIERAHRENALERELQEVLDESIDVLAPAEAQ